MFERFNSSITGGAVPVIIEAEKVVFVFKVSKKLFQNQIAAPNTCRNHISLEVVVAFVAMEIFKIDGIALFEILITKTYA